ncbi:helix-turn-helix domain-containing protein [Wansuia hejianensis]|uniref:Helix-turn-helix transcriptional regulator n=1 Tax=Wansuia hejianensis TaxID=2763667 RepID=A0A926F381_9FIRM|nr:helix-turn-helix transcriptional regulator [Wansuia hejianensis]MBC8591157.1 helix-turn-helix transcriptional regulator [Wansuia hejianensis]
MFNDNLKRERKKAGLTQEDLASELHVVRQTISKWEKGLSVPDSISLEKMSEIFEVSVANLLDSTEDVNAKINQEDILEQLVIFNEQNAEKIRTKNRIKKRVKRLGIVVIGVLVILWLGLLSIDIVRLKGNEDISKRPIVTTYLEGYAPERMYYESIGYTVYYNLTGDAQFKSGEIRVLGIPLINWE